MPTICIIAPTISPRLSYICDLIFGTLMHCDYELTTNLGHNIDTTKIYMYYNTNIFFRDNPNAVFLFQSTDFLFRTTIDAVNISPSHFNEIPVLFSYENKNSLLPFDIFAAAFYMVSRYEEYLPYLPDAHGRFSAASSVAAKHHFLQLPIVSIWTKILAQKLYDMNNNFIYKSPKYELHCTYDIDIAFAYKGKNLRQTFGRLALDTLHIRVVALRERLAVWQKQTSDPFDTFDYIITQTQKQTQKQTPKQTPKQVQKQTQNPHFLPPIFFFLLGDYSQYDKNISHKNKDFIAIIRRVAAQYQTGIHPSYLASANMTNNMTNNTTNNMTNNMTNDAQLQKEIRRLEEITANNITLSRQHYLRLQLPETYAQLLRNGITHDYTMGYADALGFRAGVAVPFRWFDVQKNAVTKLTVVPFCAMDTTLRAYLRCAPDTAVADLQALAQTLQTYGGQFGMIWHNSSLSDRDEWCGWRKVYEAFLQM